jgi:hypothetical protein
MHKPHCKKIFIIVQTLSLGIFLGGCSGLEKSEQEKIREQNAKGEYIYRHQGDHLYQAEAPRHQPREPYPWEKKD